MPDEGSMESNVSQGRGIVDKKMFRVIGADQLDRDTGGQDQDDPRGRGRPRIDKTWNTVGPDAESESGKRG